MAVMIALVAALLAGAGLVLQQQAAEQAPTAHFCGCGCSPTWPAGRDG